jgi:hypothetical protein
MPLLEAGHDTESEYYFAVMRRTEESVQEV